LNFKNSAANRSSNQLKSPFGVTWLKLHWRAELRFKKKNNFQNSAEEVQKGMNHEMNCRLKKTRDYHRKQFITFEDIKIGQQISEGLKCFIDEKSKAYFIVSFNNKRLFLPGASGKQKSGRG